MKNDNNFVSTTRKLKISKRKLEDYGWAYFMLAPTIIGLSVLNIWPIMQTFYFSLNKIVGFDGPKWVGLANFQRLFSDSEVMQATVNTFIYAIVTVPIGIVLSLLIAVLLNSNIKGKTLYRTIFFLPVISAPAAIAMVWRWLFNSDFGLINYFISFLHIKGPDWIANPHFVLLSIIIVGVWSSLGYNIVILLAGLQEIPETFYEAAEIDGAGAYRKLVSITLPLVSPTMFFVVITTLIGSLQVFDYIFMMVDVSNPALPNAQSLVYLFYKYSFVMNDKGYGSAIAIFLLVIIMIITLIQLKLQKKWVHYE